LFELEYIPGIQIYPIEHFSDLANYVVLGKELSHITVHKDIYHLADQQSFEMDFQHIKGQILAKRALALAAAGFHNALMVGAPGSGKTMMSKAMKSILPPLDFSEMLEVSQIYSVVGKLNKDLPLITQRPFRQIHHTASRFSIIGGGTQLTP
jgi:magnesium chelatase family protein